MEIYEAFGLCWQSALPLVEFTPSSGKADIAVTLHYATPPAHGANRSLTSQGVVFHHRNEPLMDVRRDAIILAVPDGWTGPVPARFFGSVTASLLALRGLAPIHGCAVATEKGAILVCGKSGSGKSTLAAAMIHLGAALISDDLSALHQTDAIYALPGRRSIRLHARANALLRDAQWLGAAARGKSQMLQPALARAPQPLHTVVVMGDNALPSGPAAQFALMQAQLFRPQLMRELPGRDARFAILGKARAVQMVHQPPLADAALDEYLRCAGRLLARL